MTPRPRHRRLLWLFPAAWRREHEQELRGTLLEADERGLAAALALARCALTLRGRALRARLAGLASVWTLAALGLPLAVASWLGGVSAGFVATALVVAVVPGTGVVYTVSSGLVGGWRRGSFAAVGCTLGIVPHLAAAALGLSGAMQAGAVAFELVRWLGVAYLVVVGVALFRAQGPLRLDGERPERDALAVVRRGVLLNLLNPKLTIFFLALLPQFLGPGAAATRLLALGAAFMLVTLAVFAGYAWASAAVRQRVLGAPAALRWLQRALGTLVLGLAVRLAATDR